MRNFVVHVFSFVESAAGCELWFCQIPSRVFLPMLKLYNVLILSLKLTSKVIVEISVRISTISSTIWLSCLSPHAILKIAGNCYFALTFLYRMFSVVVLLNSDGDDRTSGCYDDVHISNTTVIISAPVSATILVVILLSSSTSSKTGNVIITAGIF